MADVGHVITQGSSLFSFRAFRTGLTTRVEIFRDGEFVYGIKNMFTIRGAEQEGRRLVSRFEAGATVEQMSQENYEASLGW